MRTWFVISVFLLLIQESVEDQDHCGKPIRTSDRIAYGDVSVKGANPWIVSLEYLTFERDGSESWGHLCGGALLDERWILTAAHCFQTNYDDPKRWRVIAGQYDTELKECSEQRLQVETILSHENYSFSDSHDHRNDIAMIVVDGKFKLGGENVRSVCLPDSTMIFNDQTRCTIAGWGSNRGTILENADKNKLLYYNSTILPLDECRESAEFERRNRKVGAVTEDMICIKTEFDSSIRFDVDNPEKFLQRSTGGTCGGDSGGPLICEYGEYQYLAGITSWSLGNCGQNHDLFTRLHNYLDWVNEIQQTTGFNSTKAAYQFESCSGTQKFG